MDERFSSALHSVGVFASPQNELMAFIATPQTTLNGSVSAESGMD
jgi:hypothetical protein